MRNNAFVRLGVLAVLLAGCTAVPAPVTIRVTIAPRGSAQTAVGSPIPDDTGWRALGQGLEARHWRVTGVGGAADRLWLVRLDADAQARLAVRYAPDEPRRVSAWWRELQDDALLVVNAGYFTEDYRATGLLVSDGVAHGVSFAGMGGMLAVRAGRVELRWLREKPVAPDEAFDQAVQGWPMLLSAGGVPAYTEADTRVAPRTAVGLDRAGRLVFVISPAPVFTLHGLGAWLAGAGLELDQAFNLDGGQSTGLWLDPGLAGAFGAGQVAQVDSAVEIPAVLVVRR
jgi:hypothetical protein